MFEHRLGFLFLLAELSVQVPFILTLLYNVKEAQEQRRNNVSKTKETVNSKNIMVVISKFAALISVKGFEMSVDQNTISRILSVLSHPLRREILLTLSENGENSFTDLMHSLNVDTGKLSFHIRSLVGFIEQTPTGKYRLTKSGENAIGLIRDLETWAVEADVARDSLVLPLASLQKRAFAFLIDFGVVFSVFAITPLLTSLFSVITWGSPFRLDINVVLFLIVFWVYSTILEGFAGQSLGKRIVGLTIVRVDGKRIFYDHAAVRNIGKILLLLPFDLISGHRLGDKRFIRYFDKFAGTTVIDLRPSVSS